LICKLNNVPKAYAWQSGKKPDEIVAEKGLLQVSDTGEIEKIID